MNIVMNTISVLCTFVERIEASFCSIFKVLWCFYCPIHYLEFSPLSSQ
jgi:hypothetical protein